VTEATIIKHVRERCVLRDGYCRLMRLLGTGFCAGPSQWAHFGPWQRWRTMGHDAEFRHCTAGSLMLCQLHHQLYDGKFARWRGSREPILIEALSDRSADGPLVFIVNGIRYEEAA
jgi:hypothetical protein